MEAIMWFIDDYKVPLSFLSLVYLMLFLKKKWRAGFMSIGTINVITSLILVSHVFSFSSIGANPELNYMTGAAITSGVAIFFYLAAAIFEDVPTKPKKKPVTGTFQRKEI
ncbi:hypothetical protein [Priestia endophytica]|uniref:Uncharacterized protein n=1 Tax=Priestia endophytica DSM 13796 TaxID=1121089 RepID=A0A1I6C0I5_9BACI|nr:hypothetical protein [Priestia endophytica]KYG33424.1 hypothetical protein AZF06_21505 [Priestia endophytica]SFQ86698.1 hypothetical protein SAMN02745910_04702 [Priestia endophytica DSM 13796]